jgi:lysophospholipase L1-like esterase
LSKIPKVTDLPTKYNLFQADGAPINNGKRTGYQLEYFDYNACNELNQEYVSEVLNDFCELGKYGFIYQPWVQFSEPLFKGKRVSVYSDEFGLPVRKTKSNHKNNTTKIFRICVLGGSTTFGYNVFDEHTWPSYLSDILNEKAEKSGNNIQIEIINYGRGYYSPSQESILVQDLLKSGSRPSLIIFMDGVNSGPNGNIEDIPHFTSKIDVMFLKAQHDKSILRSIKDIINKLPALRLVSSLKHRSGFREKCDKNQFDVNFDTISIFANRFELSRTITISICNKFNVECLFFIQPNPLYNYSETLYRENVKNKMVRLKPLILPFYELIKKQSGVTDLSDMFSQWGYRKAIIDDVHYSPAFNEFLAKKVASYINVNSLPLYRIDKKNTGSKRTSAIKLLNIR